MSYEYNELAIEGKTKFSPSSFSGFFDNPKAWYKRNILKEDKFTGNTATVLGTLLHKRLELYWDGKTYEPRLENEYVDSYRENVEVDGWKVLEELDRLWEMIRLEIIDIPTPDETEQVVMFDIPDTEYYIAGTYDYKRGSILGDIKTTSSTPKRIRVGHRIQLLMYALALKYTGVDITEIEVTYIVKLKTKPKIVRVSEPITEDDIEWIKQEAKNMVTRLELVKANPELLDVVFFHNSDSYIQ